LLNPIEKWYPFWIRWLEVCEFLGVADGVDEIDVAGADEE